MELIILTGMSGAGKSAAVRYLEDQGFFCMDNMPPYVLPDLVNGFYKGRSGEAFTVSKLAFVVDVRSQEYLDGFSDAMAQIDEMGIPYKIIFFEASDHVLITRYQETRRKHPLAKNMSLTAAIAAERSKLLNVRSMATNIIDTTMLSESKLRTMLGEIVDADKDNGMVIFVESFGFKYGVPVDCDYCFDARFLPNPYYVPELRNHTGEEKEVSGYLEGFAETAEFIEKVSGLMLFTIPYYINEGKGSLHIGFGCTGGRHRSVYCAGKIASILDEAGYKCVLQHRDIDKEAARYSNTENN
ncbi:MAG: RNase adapter RapZ [Clostridiales bacterium]|nr:RNase adapter RapZ [Clostridiales bacterium]